MERNRTGDQSQLEVVLTRLQPMQLPAQAARQLSDQSTTLRVDSSSTEDSRRRGAQPTPDIADVQTREYWRCLPSLAAHLCSIPIALTAPALTKNSAVAL
jgi:hypothetical protein